MTQISPEFDHIPPATATSTVISHLGFHRSLLTSHSAPPLSAQSALHTAASVAASHLELEQSPVLPVLCSATRVLAIAKTLTLAVPSSWTFPSVVWTAFSLLLPFHPGLGSILSHQVDFSDLLSQHGSSLYLPLTAPLPSAALTAPCTPCILLFVHPVPPLEVILFFSPCVPNTQNSVWHLMKASGDRSYKLRPEIKKEKKSF